MCFHSRQISNPETLEKRFDAKFSDHDYTGKDRFIGFSYPKTPVITNLNEHSIDLYNWGLIPFWAKDDSIRKNTLNARIETLSEKPSFRNSIKNRCLILVDGFYEWQWKDPKGKEKQQYLITLDKDEPFAFAGIYSDWVNKETGEVLKTYSIITTEANELMAEIHNNKKRMPVILTSENEKLWLHGTDVNEFFKPQIELKAYPI